MCFVISLAFLGKFWPEKITSRDECFLLISGVSAWQYFWWMYCTSTRHMLGAGRFQNMLANLGASLLLWLAVSQSFGGHVSTRRVSHKPCFRQAHCFIQNLCASSLAPPPPIALVTPPPHTTAKRQQLQASNRETTTFAGCCRDGEVQRPWSDKPESQQSSPEFHEILRRFVAVVVWSAFRKSLIPFHLLWKVAQN